MICLTETLLILPYENENNQNALQNEIKNQFVIKKQNKKSIEILKRANSKDNDDKENRIERIN